MLTHKDHIKLYIKDKEFLLPQFVIRASFKLGVISDPFLPRDHELECIFFHVPKAAGTSLRKAIHGSKSFHIPAVRYQAVNPKRFQEYFKFCFVRNPWDRLLSAYEYLKRKCEADMSFPDHRWARSNLTDYHNFQEFVLSLQDQENLQRIKSYIHFRDQVDWISDPNKGYILADFVGYYENISQDYRRIQDILKLSGTLPMERKRFNQRDYRQLYSTKMVDIVTDIYAKDISALGYSFE